MRQTFHLEYMMSKKIFPIISDKRTITNRVYPKASKLLVAGLMLSSCLTTPLQASLEDEDSPRASSKLLPPKKRYRSDLIPCEASSAAKDDERKVQRIRSREESCPQDQNKLANPALTQDTRAKKAIADFTAALDLQDGNGQAV